MNIRTTPHMERCNGCYACSLACDPAPCGRGLPHRGLGTRLDRPKQTIVPLTFGDAAAFRQAADHPEREANDFYRRLGRGTHRAAEVRGG